MQDLSPADGTADGLHLTAQAATVTAKKLMALVEEGSDGKPSTKRPGLESVIPARQCSGSVTFLKWIRILGSKAVGETRDR
jgi:hypothetical protein